MGIVYDMWLRGSVHPSWSESCFATRFWPFDPSGCTFQPTKKGTNLPTFKEVIIIIPWFLAIFLCSILHQAAAGRSSDSLCNAALPPWQSPKSSAQRMPSPALKMEGNDEIRMAKVNLNLVLSSEMIKSHLIQSDLMESIYVHMHIRIVVLVIFRFHMYMQYIKQNIRYTRYYI